MVKKGRAVQEHFSVEFAGDQVGLEGRATAVDNTADEVIPAVDFRGGDPVREQGAKRKLALSRAKEFHGGIVGGKDLAC
jgi:hypothetical protein